MPGDYDIEYASPWAGANYLPSVFRIFHSIYLILVKLLSAASRVSAKGTKSAKWEADTWTELERLARLHPETGIHFQGQPALTLQPL